MSVLMHKVKGAMTGHHHSAGKEVSRGSSTLINKRNGNYSDTAKNETATHFIPYHLEIRNTHNSNTDPYASIGHGIHHDATTPSATDTGLAHNSTAVGTDDYLSTGFGHSHGIGSQIDTGNAHLTTSASKDSRSSRSIDDSKNDLGDAVPFTLNSAGTSTNSPDNIGPEFIPELQSQR